MPVVPKSFSYAQKKYPSEARNQKSDGEKREEILERNVGAPYSYLNGGRALHAREIQL